MKRQKPAFTTSVGYYAIRFSSWCDECSMHQWWNDYNVFSVAVVPSTFNFVRNIQGGPKKVSYCILSIVSLNIDQFFTILYQ